MTFWNKMDTAPATSGFYLVANNKEDLAVDVIHYTVHPDGAGYWEIESLDEEWLGQPTHWAEIPHI